jgi:hypothetical protein
MDVKITHFLDDETSICGLAKERLGIAFASNTFLLHQFDVVIYKSGTKGKSSLNAVLSNAR